jgi:hypothetical protein
VRTAVWVKCCGQAHTTGVDQDNCGVCVPHWGQYPTCPDCGRKLRVPNKAGICRNDECKSVRKRFDLKRNP